MAGEKHISFLVRIAMSATLAAGGLASLISSAASAASTHDPVSSVQQQLRAGSRLRSIPKGALSELPTISGDWFASQDDPYAASPGQPSDTHALVLGDTTSQKSVVVFGDSNASMWLPSMGALGKTHGFKVTAYIRFGCPYADVPGHLPNNGPVDPQCAEWRNQVIAKINSMNPTPAAVILGQFQQLTGRPSSNDPVVKGVSATLASLHVGDSPKIILVGYPNPAPSPPLCLSAHSGNISVCNGYRPTQHYISGDSYGSIEGHWYALDVAAAKKAGGQSVWLGNLFCTPKTCPEVADNTVIHALLEHVSIPWAMNVAPAFGELLACGEEENHMKGSSRASRGSLFFGGKNTPQFKADCKAAANQ